MDIAEPQYDCSEYIKVDLSDLGSVQTALDQIEGNVDALFSCAGVAGGDALMRINFISQRHIINELVARGVLGAGAAIGMISSFGGLGWQQELPLLKEFLGNTSWEAADAWIQARPEHNGYRFSKQAMNAYVSISSYELTGKGIRINAIEPGPTDTPLARANADVWLGFASEFRESVGLQASSSEDMANVLLFLCSEEAKGINGVSMLVDQGYMAARVSGTWVEENAAI